MPGVPASVTSATGDPPGGADAAAPLSELVVFEVTGDRLADFEVRQSPRVRRVSSQAIRSTSRRTRSARSVTSSRLPMGVATT